MGKKSFCAFGGNSLTSLALLLEIERRTGHALPLAAMSAAPTIEGLAALLRGTAAVTADVHLRAATRDDIDAICALLEQASAEGTFEQMDATMWRHIFDYSWITQKPDIGYVLAAGAEIVGFLGCHIYALRELNGKRGLVFNFTSWYVRPAYRGWGTALLTAALRDGVTYTSLSPTPNSQQALAMLGFSTLGTHRLWLPPGLHADTLRHQRPEIIMRSDQVRAALDAAGQRRIRRPCAVLPATRRARRCGEGAYRCETAGAAAAVADIVGGVADANADSVFGNPVL